MAIEKDGVLGLGLKYTKQSPGSANRDVDENPASHETEDKGKKTLGPLSNKTSTYLSQFILYIAAIGDIVDGTDTTHDFNFFSLVYEWPKDVSVSFSCSQDIFHINSLPCYSCLWYYPLILFLFGDILLGFAFLYSVNFSNLYS